jgi:hypothetical protein
MRRSPVMRRSILSDSITINFRGIPLFICKFFVQSNLIRMLNKSVLISKNSLSIVFINGNNTVRNSWVIKRIWWVYSICGTVISIECTLCWNRRHSMWIRCMELSFDSSR